MGVRSIEAWREALLALLPPSSMINRQPGGVLVRVLEACGASMRAIERLAVSLVAQFDPLLADELLEDWERLYDLPDECLDAPVGKEQRRQRVNMRRLMLGGASPEYFRQMVIGLGYPDARIDEFRPFRANSKCTAAINQGLALCLSGECRRLGQHCPGHRHQQMYGATACLGRSGCCACSHATSPRTRSCWSGMSIPFDFHFPGAPCDE